MCSNVLRHGDIEFACRRCNECLTAKKNDWIARAMAESNTSQHMMVIALTYNDETEDNRDGSIVFNYQHIRGFLSRLRNQIEYKTKQRESVRFLCAGEHGSDNDRVHWHIIIFTDYDLTDYGKWKCFSTVVNSGPNKGTNWGYKRGDLVTEKEHKFDINITWTLWPHGFVHLQQADQGGVEYALKYAFKDQFNVEKSRGTMRETKSENHAASYFRMSKQPPIGEPWLREKLSRLRAKGAVLTSLKLNIQGYTGYWYPKGNLREYLLYELYDINQSVNAETGRYAPQMDALINSVQSQEKELEILQYGKQIEQEENEENWEFERRIKLASKETADTLQKYNTRRQCGSVRPCYRCERGFNNSQKKKAAEWAAAVEWDFNRQPDKDNYADYESWFHKKRQINPFCNFENAVHVQKAFNPYYTR